MKIVVAMDSFKGSLTSLQAGNAVRDGILDVCPDADITVLPLADGGEGTIDVLAPYINGETKHITVTGPSGRPVDSEYIFERETKTAYIEMARASGLTLVDPSALDPFNATSFGTGELIKDAAGNGAGKLVVFIGGSATNDAGAGMLQALGARLTDCEGYEIKRGAIGLNDLFSIDTTGLTGRDLAITVACDVTNPLCGKDGASHVYGPQKGATYEMAQTMDGWLLHFASVAGFDPYEPGTGAAGGMSFALKNFLGASVYSGADIVTGITKAESLIKDSDLVITGEGRMDSQTVNGKAPYKILEYGIKHGKKVTAVTGVLGDGYEECLKAGFDRIFPLAVPTMLTDEAIESVKQTAGRLISCYAG